MKNITMATVVTGLAILFTSGGEAVAQTVAGDATADTDSANQIADIVVTARRVSENLATVPITASAFDSDSLRAASITNPQSLQQIVAGVFLSGSGSPQNTQYAVRGSATPVAGAGSPGVITYFADVPMTPYVSSTPQYDLASIQILKGPQGTLFGRNSVGGALLIYPAKPTYELGGYVQGTIGNFNTRILEGALNVPIVMDKVALRVAGRLDRADGYTRNLGVGGDLGNQHDNNVRASLLVQPTDWLSNITIFDYAGQPRSKGNGSPVIVVSSGIPFPFVQQLIEQQVARGPQVTDTGTLDGYAGWHNWGITNRTDITLGAIEITNIFGYRDVKDDALTNLDGVPGAFFDSSQLTRKHQYSNEVQIRGKLFSDRLNWLVGGFYSDSPPDYKVNQPSLAALGVPVGPLGYLFYGEKSKALFVNLNYEVTDGVHISAGYRYTWDTFSACSGSGEAAPPAMIEPDECLTKLANPSFQKGKSKAPTWTIGADWQASENAFLYITSRRGYRAAGLNSPRLGPLLVPYQTFRPEKTTDVEVGTKLNFNVGGASARLNASAFRTRTDNVQVVGVQVATGTFQAADLACTPTNPAPFIDGDCDLNNDPAQTVLTLNAGKTTVTGFEIEGVLSPARGLTLSGSAAFLKSKTNEYVVPAFLQPFFPVGEVPLLFTPKQTFTGAASYTTSLGGSTELAFNAQYYHSGSVDFYGYVARPYDVVSGRVDVRNIAASGLDVGVFVRNLFNNDYVSGSALTSTAGIPTNSILYGMPRTFGVEVRYTFGK